MDILVIGNCDFEELEEQRKALGELADLAQLEFKEPENENYIQLVVDRRDLNALVGISNMLDAWSDGRYHEIHRSSL